MIKNDRIINSIAYGDMVHKMIKEKNIDLTEARRIISEMSFIEYRKLEEASADITPPSGQPLSPAINQQSKTTAPLPQTPNQQQTDPRGIQVKNPLTGKMEWMKPTDQQSQPGHGVPPGQAGAANQLQQQAMSEERDLARMRQLAGIKEDASCGSTGAGSIAIAPTAMGKVKRRQPTNEQQPKEYTRTESPKTIVGDTKPAQASGELSANLAARGKKTASRTNNGLRR